jgi:hypothetical protein
MLNGFFLGITLAFIKPLFYWIFSGYEHFREWQREREYQRQQQSHQQKSPPHQEQTQQQHDTERTRRAREAEAERQRQRGNTQNANRQESHKPESRKEELDTRTHEEVLGLASGWTQDDLLKAYRREAQRLHPDKWTGKPPMIREAMEQEFKRVQEAYQGLKRLG